MTPQNCTICGDEPTGATSHHVRLPCPTHWVCKDCLPNYFNQAAENEAFFPPSCCQHILPLEQFIEFLPVTVVQRFIEKQEEYSVLAR